MQGVAAETANIPNSNPMQQLLAMNANMLQLVTEFNLLQGQLVAGHNTIVGSLNTVTGGLNAVVGGLNAVIERLDLVPMRAHNAAAPASGLLQYPPGIVAAPPLPTTVDQALSGLSGAQYLQAINALIAANAPGLAPIANNATTAVKRQHFLSYMGLYV